MNAPLVESISVPKHIVRPLMDGEALPFYSTAELLLGVCHLVTVCIPPKPTRERQQRILTPWKTIEFKMKKARDKFARLAPEIIELLRQNKTNGEIAAQLGMPNSLLANYMRRDAELRRLSAERPRSQGYIKARKQTSVARFAQSEKEIRHDVKDIGITAAAIKHKFDLRTLRRYLGARNA